MSRKPSPHSAITLGSDTARHPSHGGPLTSERIAHDLDTFRAGGGNIEVLGTTRVLTPSEQSLLPKPPKRSS